MGGTNGEPESALKPLRTASGAVEVLRDREADPQARRGALLKVMVALEGSLRRLLRDDARVPIDLRLQALAPDELPTSEVVAELRRRDRISIELAAAFH
ncbi:MAG TPA: hypothetical protein VHG28_11625, partial [Longimicrobiaceae bacterium]|nr:hypothetical protein [Longimicrobiaceae bacterium]